MNPYRLELARKMGVTRAVNVKETTLPDVQKELGMAEGFDVGMEMSGSPDAFRDLLANMCHGGRIALLGLLPRTEIDWDKVGEIAAAKGGDMLAAYDEWIKPESTKRSEELAEKEMQKRVDAKLAEERKKQTHQAAHEFRNEECSFPVPIIP